MDELNNVNENESSSPEPMDVNLKKRYSYATAYLLWLFTGWLGLHRFYLRRWFSGLIYMFSFGLFGLGWVLDLFIIPYLIKKARISFQEEVKANPKILEVEQEEEVIAPWATDRLSGFIGALEAPIRYVFFIFAPLFFVFLAIFLQQVQLAIIFILILAFVGLLGSVNTVMKKYQYLEKLPVLGEVLATLQQLNDFYFQNRPRSFITYLFYPLLGILILPFSKTTRREYGLYLKIFGPIVLLLTVETMYSFLSMSYLTREELLIQAAVLILFIGFIVMCFAMPMFSTSFRLSLSGRRKTLRFLTVLALLFAIPTGVAIWQMGNESLTFFSAQILEARIQKEGLQNEMEESSAMFLSYHIPRQTTIDRNIAIHPELTKKYRSHIAGLAVEDQASAFAVLTFLDQYKQKLAAISMKLANNKIQLVYVYSAGKIYNSWKDLPEDIKTQLKTFSEEVPSTTAPGFENFKPSRLMKEFHPSTLSSQQINQSSAQNNPSASEGKTPGKNSVEEGSDPTGNSSTEE